MQQPNRIEIKQKAREKIKDNLWNIWKPLIVVGLIGILASSIITTLFYKEIDCTVQYKEMLDGVGFDASVLGELKCTQTTGIGGLLNFVMTYAEAVLGVGVICYILKLVRGEEFELKNIFK